MNTKILFFSILSILCFTNISGQIKNENLPSLDDWFLSTGEWHVNSQIYVRELGTGERPIIMLNGGWGGEHGGFIKSIAGLEKDYRFIFYDQRGSLRSPFADSLITFDGHIRDLERLREELDLDQITIIAHSMGCVLASSYAAQYPDRVKQLILLAPAYLINPLSEEDATLQNQSYQKQQEYMKRSQYSDELEKYNLQRENSELTSKENTAKFRINFANRMLYDIRKWPALGGGRALYKGHVFGLTQNTYPTAGWNYYDEFSKANYSVDIIIGDHDFLDMGNHLIKKWTSNQPDIELTILESAGHILWIDQPELFRKTLKSTID